MELRRSSTSNSQRGRAILQSTRRRRLVESTRRRNPPQRKFRAADPPKEFRPSAAFCFGPPDDKPPGPFSCLSVIGCIATLTLHLSNRILKGKHNDPRGSTQGSVRVDK